jgi:hypothetical protein
MAADQNVEMPTIEPETEQLFEALESGTQTHEKESI